MARAAKEVVVDAPLTAVYNQWTQFEEFPEFMEGVVEVRQLDDKHLHWLAVIGGREAEWDAEIQEQVPDERIVWRATEGDGNAGWVTFERVSAEQTRVHLEMSYEPEGILQNVADALGFVDRQVEGDLKRFKAFIEERGGMETGAWRGEIENPKAPDGHTEGQGTQHVDRL
ncbi:MAG: SRPBCC family protein [Dehalococcoidia bacterium]|nr:SRPBCC family protein [Dehalococcoidia bacterium]